MANRFLKLNEIQKLYESMQPFRRICKCGHTVYISNRTGRIECKHCHNLVFKDAKTEFEYRIKKELIKEKRNLK